MTAIKKRNNINRITRIFYFLSFILSLPFLSYLIINNCSVQNLLGAYLTNQLAKNWGVTITSSRISFDLFHGFKMENLYISDLSNDSLLFIRNTTIDIQHIYLKKKQIILRLIELESPKINLKTDSNNQLNIVNLFNKIFQQSDSTDKTTWQINIRNIAIENSNVQLQSNNKSDTIDIWRFKDLKIRIKNLSIEKQKLGFKINRLTFIDNRGFLLSNLSTQVEIEHNKLKFSNLNIYTPTSGLEIKNIELQSDSIKTYQIKKKNLTVKANVSFSKISSTDLSYFIPIKKAINHEIRFKGEIYGNINNLKCKHVIFSVNNRNIFKGNIHYTHIDNLDLPYLYIDVNQLTLWPEDIENIVMALSKNNDYKIPSIFHKFEYLTYKGNYTGFFDDFVMYGQVSSPMGNINMDILIRPVSKQDFEFNGSIETKQFQIGKFIDFEKIIGPTDLHIITNGKLKNGTQLEASINVNVRQTSINGYLLENFNAKGTIDKNVFQGTTSINHPGINVGVDGLFDFSNKYPQFNFKAHIKNINLLSLNVFKSDSITRLSGNLEANFKGNSIDEFDGKINISNLFIANQNNECFINEINIESLNNETAKLITLTSNIADVRIDNPYNSVEIYNDIFERLHNYFSNSNIKNTLTNNPPKNLKIEAKFKNINPLIQLFNPELYISDNTFFTIQYNPIDTTLNTIFRTKLVSYKSLKWENLQLNFNAYLQKGELNISSHQLSLGKNISLQKMDLQIKTQNGQASFTATWQDSLNHKNIINLYGNAIIMNQEQLSNATIEIDSSIIYMLNKPWHIHKSHLVYDSSGLNILHFWANNNISTLQVSGKYSTNQDNTLTVDFKNFDMSFINYLLQTHIAKFEGNINAKIYFSNANNNKKIECLGTIDQFKINEQVMGQTQIWGDWNQNKQQIELTINCETEKYKTIQAEGYYIPENKKLQLNFFLNQIPLSILQPIVEPTLILPSGAVSGNLNLNYKRGNPTLNGKLAIKNGDILISLLNTHYSFDNQVIITNNKFIFEPFELIDEYQQKLSCKGEISNINLKDFSVNFTIGAKNNLVFKKNEPDRLPFYGIGFASGNIKIYGPTEKIKIDITQANTEKNTEIIIPLDQKQLTEESNFISFINGSEKNQTRITNINKENYVVNNSKVMLNFDLDVTPAADLKILFNPKIGDALHAQGHGNLKFEIDNSGTFYLRGFYNIDGGEYTFTMQNLMNKKFILQSNSNITFTGNPNDATIDILAVYHTRAALYNLIGDPSIEYKKRIPVDCQLFITGKLVNPDIRLSIDLPNAAEETKTRVRSVLNSDQEMSQQFLALLVLNNFIPTTSNNLQNRFETTNIGRDAATTTSFELLTSQLSSWVSQLSKDFDIGVSYRPGDQIYSNEDLEIALSTQLLNNRMIINSNIDIIGSQNQTGQTNNSSTNLIGDINIEYRLTDKLSFKAFNRSNDIIYFQDDIYTRGVGIIYREEFSSLKELTQRYFKKLSSSKSDTLKK